MAAARYGCRCERCRCPIAGNSIVIGSQRFCSVQCMKGFPSHRAPGYIPSTYQAPRLCRFPGCQRPCYIAGGKVHDYCGITHARQHQSGPQTCRLPGCYKHCFVEGGRVHDYCGRSNARHGGDPQPETGVKIIYLKEGSRQFERLKRNFITYWCHKKGEIPDIIYILEVINPRLKERLKDYVANLPPGLNRVEEFYHGTSFKCRMPRSDPCSNKECGACRISDEGFDPARISSGAWQRFGKGFYFAVNSSKAYEYPLSLYRQTGQPRHRCLLVCEVAPGRKYQLSRSAPSLAGPPPGCHSVFGTASSPRSDLNYDEIAVYTTKAIRPRYILILENTFVLS